MSAKNLESLNNNKPAQEPRSRGAGLSGTTTVTTATVAKDAPLPTVAAITQPVHNGGYVPHTQVAVAPPASGVNPYGK